MATQYAAPSAHNVILFQESLFLDQKSNLVVAIHALQLTTGNETRSNNNREGA